MYWGLNRALLSMEQYAGVILPGAHAEIRFGESIHQWIGAHEKSESSGI